MIRILTRSDSLSGLLFVALGVAFMTIALDYEYGSAREMGPGYFPRILSGLLIAFGVIQVFKAAAAGESGPRPVFSVRPAVFVLGGMAVFALGLHSLGIVVSAFLLVVIAGVVAPGRRWAEIALAGVLLAAFAAFLFVKGLGLDMPLWPEIL